MLVSVLYFLRGSLFIEVLSEHNVFGYFVIKLIVIYLIILFFLKKNIFLIFKFDILLKCWEMMVNQVYSHFHKQNHIAEAMTKRTLNHKRGMRIFDRPSSPILPVLIDNIMGIPRAHRVSSDEQWVFDPLGYPSFLLKKIDILFPKKNYRVFFLEYINYFC